LACRYLIFEGAATGSVSRQFLLFVGSSAAFRILEYVAFLGCHTIGGLDYVLASMSILLTTTLLKFLYYRKMIFQAEQGALP
jgi:hypothetical protein